VYDIEQIAHHLGLMPPGLSAVLHMPRVTDCAGGDVSKSQTGEDGYSQFFHGEAANF